MNRPKKIFKNIFYETHHKTSSSISLPLSKISLFFLFFRSEISTIIPVKNDKTKTTINITYTVYIRLTSILLSILYMILEKNRKKIEIFSDFTCKSIKGFKNQSCKKCTYDSRTNTSSS